MAIVIKFGKPKVTKFSELQVNTFFILRGALYLKMGTRDSWNFRTAELLAITSCEVCQPCEDVEIVVK